MKKTIGRREKISIPTWGLKQVSAKIDTGAYTSSIHCEFVELREENGLRLLCFKLLRPSHRKYNDQLICTEDFTQKRVKNSFGDEEIRFMVRVKVSMFGEKILAEFTLTDRTKMKNPILLGRKLLRGRFKVDVDSVNLSRKSSKK